MSRGTQILTKRLALLPYLHPDTELLKIHTRWMHDPEVVRFSEHRHTKPSWHQNKRYVASFDHQVNHLWAILDKRVMSHHNNPWEDFYIGHLACYGDVPNKSAELAIVVGEKSIWGKGFGLEAWTGAMEWLLQEGCRKVFAGTMAENRAMIRICEKSGMQREGARKAHFLLDGQPTDFVMFAKFGSGEAR